MARRNNEEEITLESNEVNMEQELTNNALVNANAEIASLKEKAANAELRLAEYEAAGLKAGVILETGIPARPVKVGGKKYKFTMARFNHNSVVMTAAEAALSEEVLEQLVAIPGQGLLQEIK